MDNSLTRQPGRKSRPTHAQHTHRAHTTHIPHTPHATHHAHITRTYHAHTAHTTHTTHHAHTTHTSHTPRTYHAHTAHTQHTHHIPRTHHTHHTHHAHTRQIRTLFNTTLSHSYSTYNQDTPFVYTSPVALPAAMALSHSKSFVFQNTYGGKPDGFSTLYHLTKTLHSTSTEWLTVETGAWRLSLNSQFCLC